MKKRFRMYFSSDEFVIAFIVFVCVVFVDVIAATAVNKTGALWGAIIMNLLLVFVLIGEAKCFHFMKITDSHISFSVCGITIKKININRVNICFGTVYYGAFSRGAFIFSESKNKKFSISRIVWLNIAKKEKYYYCIFSMELVKILKVKYGKPIEITTQRSVWGDQHFLKEIAAVEEYNKQFAEMEKECIDK